MNEPEQNQPINPDEGQEAAGAAPVSSSSPSDQSAQPEFGQYNQPEYGAMSNQYPANYNHTCMGLPTSPSRRTMHNKRRSSRRRIRICRTGIRRIHMMHRDGSNQASQWLSVWTKSIRAKPVWAESIPTARHISHQPE